MGAQKIFKSRQLGRNIISEIYLTGNFNYHNLEKGIRLANL
jgi:hypothetical protein